MEIKDEIYKNLSKDLIELETEAGSLEDKINNYKKYNFLAFLKRCGVNVLSAIHYCAPYTITAIILATSPINGLTKRETVTKYAQVQAFDTSSGYHQEYSSYDYSYSDKSIEYTTGWEEKNGYFTRTITEYRLSDEIDLKDLDTIFKMSKEELESLLVATDIKTISKPYLSDEDALYDEPAIVINNYYDSETEFREREESDLEVALEILLYICLNIGIGFALMTFEKTITKSFVNKKLANLKVKYRSLDEDDLADFKEKLEKLQKLIAIKKPNVDLLTDAKDPTIEIASTPRKPRR